MFSPNCMHTEHTHQPAHHRQTHIPLYINTASLSLKYSFLSDSIFPPTTLLPASEWKPSPDSFSYRIQAPKHSNQPE
uniref:Uncharacterized protein n=1 Tax=Anguilla anguilla TaxID=7936 RepID=A0A0E9UN48_ANGAN